MWWFTSGKVEQKISELDANVAESFQHAKADIQVLQKWICYLHQQQKTLCSQMAESEENLRGVPTKDSVAEAVAQASEHFAHQLREAETRLKTVEFNLGTATGRITSAEERLDRLQPLPRQIHELREHVASLTHRREEKPIALPAAPSALSRFKEKVLHKLTTHSKEYVKGILLNTIHRYGHINGQQLRELIVDEQGLCSRSSFYRLLEELEADSALSVISDGKSKTYHAAVTQRSR